MTKPKPPLSDRQMILGQYIQRLFFDGVITRDAAPALTAKKIYGAIEADLSAVFALVFGEAAKRIAQERLGGFIDGFLEKIRG